MKRSLCVSWLSKKVSIIIQNIINRSGHILTAAGLTIIALLLLGILYSIYF